MCVGRSNAIGMFCCCHMPLALTGNRPSCCRLDELNHLCSIFRGIYKYLYTYIYVYQLQSQPLLPGNEANVTICRRRCRLVFATQCATATTNCIQMKQFALKADDGEAGKTNFQLEIAYFYSTHRLARCIRQRQTRCKSVRFVCRMALELDLIEFCPHWLNITHTPRCTECN